MEALLAFGAALLSLRLAGGLAGRWRVRRSPELAAWACALLAYALASAALAWGAAHGWDARAFRAYYLFGGLLTAPLLGAGSLLLVGRRWAAPVAFLYSGLAIGVMVAVPVHGVVHGNRRSRPRRRTSTSCRHGCSRWSGTRPERSRWSSSPCMGIRRRPLGNALILAGVGTAAVGSALAGLGEAGTALFIAAAALLLYLGFVTPTRWGDRRVASEGSASLPG